MQGPLVSGAMIALNLIMMVYTLWVISLSDRRYSAKVIATLGGGLVTWLALLHLGLSTESLFPGSIEGLAFLLIIFGAVGTVGLLLLLPSAIRRIILALDQQQLMLFQGIRVFYGAMFLCHASLGVLPLGFGIVDGFTHISAGFFALVAAHTLASRSDGERRAWFANVFGLMDILVVASSIALVLLADIGPHHPIMYAVFLPAPLWFWFHFVSIWKLVEGRRTRRS